MRASTAAAGGRKLEARDRTHAVLKVIAGHFATGDHNTLAQDARNTPCGRGCRAPPSPASGCLEMAPGHAVHA